MIRPGPPVAVVATPGAGDGADTAGTAHPSPPLMVPDPEELRRAKARAAARASAQSGPAAAASASTPRATIFGGLNSQGLVAPAGSGTPPDSTGAIGPGHYIEFINSAGMGLYDRTDIAAPLATATPQAFLGVGATERVFDPQILFDPVANRWFYVVDHRPPSPTPSPNALAYGWSKTASPTNLTADWCRFEINTGTEFDDYPKLGHNDNHILIGANVFDPTDFLTSRIWAVPKPPNGDTSCTPPIGAFPFGSAANPLRTADNDFAFTPVPANTFEPAANGYIVAADSPSVVTTPSQIMAWHVSGPAGAPVLTPDGNMNVSAFSSPANVPQPSGAPTLDSLDTRLTQAVAHTDPAAPGGPAVWTQHTINGPGGRAQVRWYELLPGSLAVRQEGNISDPAHFVFNGAISPTSNGASAAINFNVGSSSQLAQIHGQSRISETPLGQMTGDVLLVTSAGIMQDFSCVPAPCRWGDYAGASPDPNNTRAVWGTSQFNQAPSGTDARWATENFALDVGLDTNVPDTSAAGPLGLPGTRNPSFTFTATEPATFECQLDSAAFASCSSPQAYTGLANGAHTFAVRATDFAPNTDPTPASIAFNVDAIAPNATIDGKKKIKKGKNAKFRLGSSEPNSTFQCQLDGKEIKHARRAFAPCTSPLKIKKPKKGKHKLEVQAIDAAGNVGPTATKKFKVKKKKRKKN